MSLDLLFDSPRYQEILDLFMMLIIFFLRYVVFCSLIPLGCSKLIIGILSFTLSLCALNLMLNRSNESPVGPLNLIHIGPALWLNQFFIGFKLALPYLITTWGISFLAAMLEILVGCGFLSLFSPWFRSNSSTLRTLMDSWAIGVVLLPGQFRHLVNGLFGDVTLMAPTNSQLFGLQVHDLISWVADIFVGIGSLLNEFAPLLLIYLLMDMSLMMICKVLNKGMFQGELSLLKGALTLLFFAELST